MSGAPSATVLIPTHDHGPLLELAGESVLGQTVRDLELFIVGDGPTGVTRRIAEELQRRDGRVRYFHNPKGPRHGEIHRHAALQHARGRAVLYLSDDDLWFPDHVETMLAELASHDFASAVTVVAARHGASTSHMNNLGNPLARSRLMAGERGINLSAGAHTLEVYRALEHGWRTTPAEIATDRYMWQQLLADPANRATTTTRPTVLHLPSPHRRGMTLDERLAEMRGWQAAITDPVTRGELYAEACSKALARIDRHQFKLQTAQLRSPRARVRAAASRLMRIRLAQAACLSAVISL